MEDKVNSEIFTPCIAYRTAFNSIMSLSDKTKLKYAKSKLPRYFCILSVNTNNQKITKTNKQRNIADQNIGDNLFNKKHSNMKKI